MAGGSAFFPLPAPIVRATKSRTELSRESQPDGGLRKKNTVWKNLKLTALIAKVDFVDFVNL